MRPLPLLFLALIACLSLATLATSRTLWDDHVIPAVQIAEN